MQKLDVLGFIKNVVLLFISLFACLLIIELGLLGIDEELNKTKILVRDRHVEIINNRLLDNEKEKIKYGYQKLYYVDSGLPINYDLNKAIVGDDMNYVLNHNWSNMNQSCNSIKNNEYLIILVGDSVIADFSEKNFEGAIKEILDPDFNVVVKNFGVPGYNLIQINELFRFNVLQCNPDIVIYGFFQNDLNENIYIESEKSEKKYQGLYLYAEPSLLKKIPLRDILQKFRTYNFFENKVINIITKITLNRGVHTNFLESLIIEKKFENALYDMYKESKNNNINFFLINFPFIDSNDYNTFDFPSKFAQKYNVHLVDVRKNYLQNNIMHTQIQKGPSDFGHYNDYGRKLVTRYVVEDLKSVLFKKETHKNDSS